MVLEVTGTRKKCLQRLLVLLTYWILQWLTGLWLWEKQLHSSLKKVHLHAMVLTTSTIEKKEIRVLILRHLIIDCTFYVWTGSCSLMFNRKESQWLSAPVPLFLTVECDCFDYITQLFPVHNMNQTLSPSLRQCPVHLAAIVWVESLWNLTPHRPAAHHTWRPDNKPAEFKFPCRYWQFG